MYGLNIKSGHSVIIDQLESLEKLTQTGMAWLHFEDEMAVARDWLGSTQLDTESINALCDELTRPRIFVNFDNELVITLRTITWDDSNPIELNSLRVWTTQSHMVSLSRFAIPAVQTVRQKLMSNAKGIHNPFQLLWYLCDHIADQLTQAVEAMDDKLSHLELNWEENHHEMLSSVHAMRFDIVRMRRFLSPQLDALQTLSNVLVDQISSKKEKSIHLARWREAINATKRDIEALTEMNERMSILQDSIKQRIDQISQRTMYILSVVAAFFLPLTFIASLLGMNVAGIPASDHFLAFAAVSGLMVLIGLCQWVLFRRWNWL